MRDELGSCAPGSFTAVALFYIYGAAAGPAVARCESHDSGAGNRDGPVILAPHRLHVTPPALPILLLDAHHSPQRQAQCPQTHTHIIVLFLLRTHPSICFPGPSLPACALMCPYLILLIRPRLFTEVSILRSESPSITLLQVLREQTVLLVLISPSTSAWRGRIQYMSPETLEQLRSAAH